MRLRQIRILLAIAENGLNITAAAEKLFTSQPGVSKQLKLLEEELQLKIFSRKGKSLEAITAEGEEVIRRAESIMREVEAIQSLSALVRRRGGCAGASHDPYPGAICAARGYRRVSRALSENTG